MSHCWLAVSHCRLQSHRWVADGAIDIAEFKELKNPLIAQTADLEGKIVALERSKTNRLEPLRKWIFEANTANIPVFNNNWDEMKSFLGKVGTNCLLRAQTLTISFMKPFDSLVETVVSLSNFPDDSSRCLKWWSLGGSNP